MTWFSWRLLWGLVGTGKKKPRAISGAGFQDFVLCHTRPYPAPRLVIEIMAAMLMASTRTRATGATPERTSWREGLNNDMPSKLSNVRGSRQHEWRGVLAQGRTEICDILHKYAEYCIIARMRKLFWLGSSKHDLMAFPDASRQVAGYQLGRVQAGMEPQDWKPMTSVGVGVREIRIREASGAFRVLYLATRPEGVYVLHAFQKKPRKTRQRDLQLAQERLKLIAR
ncbi:MAG TPA: type II toxin-antitoxin system RelE/ParE family toxin [Oleiagrimonas sp.]|nr:type II toxin-antitoxin system RelE/ParE family toxin [Oleiagrimonas sp.]